jgi:glycosyltransferase involved in cell wall biosynthesis
MNSHKVSHIPKLSIVVCTFQRPDHLAQLLNALQKQTASLEDFEIVVVDNETQSNHDVQVLCASTQYQDLPLRYIHHPKPGLSSARNCGVNESRANLVAFLDDDMLPSQDWVTRVSSVRASSGADAFGGPNTPFYTSTPPKWFKDAYASNNFGIKAHWLARHKTLIGGNSVWDKDLFIRFGGFSENFGYVGTRQRFGEDNDLCERVQQAGIGLWYDPTLNVQHHFESERMSLRWKMTTIMHHSQMKAHLVLRETRALDKRPVFVQILSVSRKLLFQSIRFIKVCWLGLFRKKNKYPYLENYVIEKVGPELRQVSLMFEMIYCMVFNSHEIRVGLK